MKECSDHHLITLLKGGMSLY